MSSLKRLSARFFCVATKTAGDGAPVFRSDTLVLLILYALLVFLMLALTTH